MGRVISTELGGKLSPCGLGVGLSCAGGEAGPRKGGDQLLVASRPVFCTEFAVAAYLRVVQ